MQKRSIFIVAIVAVIALMAYPVFAGGPSKPSGKSNTGQLYLYEKICSTDTWADGEDIVNNCPAGEFKPWPIVAGGAWGKMTYSLSGATFDFVFNGHGLPVGVDFTLIYYPDDWSVAQAGNIICLGSGVVNGGGNIHIAGPANPGSDLPNTVVDIGDCNYGNTGAKIWLVLSNDVDCSSCIFTTWTCPANAASSYLFEADVIFFTYTP